MKTLFFGTPDFNQQEIDSVSRVVKSKWVGFGKISLEFEKKLCQYLKIKHGAVLNSCTAALHLGLILNKVKPGDEIITTPLTFAATANAIEYTGAKPVFIDIDPETFNIDASLIEKAITKNTKGILAVHFGGLPCQMEKIDSIAKKYNLFVMEDAAHAIGAKYYGRFIGDSKNIACFSFYANKNLSTIDGGLICCRNAKEKERVKILSMSGLSGNAWKRYSDNDIISNEVVELGYKYNLADVHSAIGLKQLAKLERNLKIRKKYAKVYDKILSSIEGVKLQSKFDDKNIRHALHLFLVAIDPDKFTASRNRIVFELRKNGIFAVVHYTALHLHKYYREKYHYQEGDLPIAESICRNILTLPLLPQYHLSLAERIATTTKKILLSYRK